MSDLSFDEDVECFLLAVFNNHGMIIYTINNEYYIKIQKIQRIFCVATFT